MKTIGFVILHYGDVDVTRRCIESIQCLDTMDDLRIVIVDNDYNKSQQDRDRTKQSFEMYPKLRVLRIMEDAGFSKANNIGYAYMKENYNPDYIVIANNDITFEQKDFVERIKAVTDKTQCDVVGPDIFSLRTRVHQSPIDVTMRTRGQVNYTIWMNAICLKLFPICYPLLRKNMAQNAVRTDAVDWKKSQQDVVLCGACIIFTKKFIENEEKAFYPETKFYYEEYILQHRCQEKGYKIGYFPDVQVQHADGVATTTKNVDEKKRIRFIMQNTLQSAKIYKRLITTEDRKQ